MAGPSLAFQLTSVAYLALLATAVAYDVWTFRIPNAVVLGIAALFVPAVLTAPQGVPWLAHIAAGLIVFALAAGLFFLGVMGGGDAKLLGAAALWVGLDRLLALVLIVAVLGGLLAVAVLMARRFTGYIAHPAMPASLRAGEPLPYGVAIAAAAALLHLRGWPG
jgi:prepilin peptidase CpaA